MSNYSPKESSNFKEVKYVPNKIGKFKTTDKKADTLFLYFAILTGCMPMLAGSSIFVWTSPVLSKLESNDTNINPLDKPITTMEISLVTGLPCLTGPIGAILLARLSDKIGRKTTLQIVALGMLCFSIIIAFSHQIIYIIIARCCTFIFLYGSVAIMPVYLTELCEDHNRAKFGCIMGFITPLGTLYCFVFGPLFSVRDFTIILALPVMLFLPLSYFIVETPIYSLSKNKKKECRNIIKKLRSNKSDKELEIEFNKIHTMLNNKENTNKIEISSIFQTKETRIGMVLTIIPFLIAQCSGASIILQFLGPIFNDASFFLSGDDIAICVAVLKCIIYFTSSLIVERTGRKPLLLCSSIGCSIPLALMGWYFYLQYTNSSLRASLNWLPLLGLSVYMLSFSIGLGPIAPSLSGEMFSTDLRAVASSIIASTTALSIFFLSFGFPIVADSIGYHWCFWMFSFSCLVGSVAIYFLIPETRGRSLDDIQMILRNYRFEWKRKI